MNPAACIVAVDVGNTAVKLAVEQFGEVIDHSIVINQTNWELSAIEWVCERLGCKQMQWRVASVHRRAATRLVDAVEKAAPDATIDLITFRDVPMPVAVDHPERLGIDRLLSAYAAHRLVSDRVSGPANSGLVDSSPLVVVDAGSAVTIDWVDESGTFCGGVILPGLALQASVLATGTDALPHIDWTESRDVQLPATNTANAIHAGILVGVAAAIDGFADRYIENWQVTLASKADSKPAALANQSTVKLVLTGGDSAALSAHVRRPHCQKTNLVCRGLLCLPQTTTSTLPTQDR
ncbi:type III pantothenate kinase [Rubripirellula reticaptiva]|uniref:Type III pantothenate kinase n=1 Tax=Rubripirellula reticaptiva TaxID=2528013 RepID=A0A5C6FBT4_9BACT|nr:type III pantothenate kinase [Rubripirellula reticaptiva]TWU58027.1 Type III pantothenate kinase [Rubripirellula reticaptiva]